MQGNTPPTPKGTILSAKRAPERRKATERRAGTPRKVAAPPEPPATKTGPKPSLLKFDGTPEELLRRVLATPPPPKKE